MLENAQNLKLTTSRLTCVGVVSFSGVQDWQPSLNINRTSIKNLCLIKLFLWDLTGRPFWTVKSRSMQYLSPALKLSTLWLWLSQKGCLQTPPFWTFGIPHFCSSTSALLLEIFFLYFFLFIVYSLWDTLKLSQKNALPKNLNVFLLDRKNKYRDCI